jgi:hypothetical protein
VIVFAGSPPPGIAAAIAFGLALPNADRVPIAALELS